MVAAIGALLATDIGAVFAQASPSNSADPGEIRRRIEQQQLPQPRRSADPGRRIDLYGRPPVDIAPRWMTPDIEPLSFVLAAVVIDGATVFSPEDFRPLYGPHMAKQIRDREVEEILAAITALYRDNGYFLSRAVAAPQPLDHGVLRISVIEGYVSHVSFDGTVPDMSRLHRIAAKMVGERPSRRATFERALYLINDLHGLSAEAGFTPHDDDPQQFAATFAIEHDVVDAAAAIDNRGTRAVGRDQAWLIGGLNGAFGHSERLQLRFSSVPSAPRELLFLELLYDQPIGAAGTSLSATASASQVDAGADLALLETESESQFISVGLSHPLIRSRRETLWLSGALEYLDLREERLGLLNFEDRVRSARLALRYVRDDDFDGTTSTNLSIGQGLDVFGASKPRAAELSRPDGRSDYTTFVGEIRRDQHIFDQLYLHLAATGQRSTTPLLTSEEFAVGGAVYGRGYDVSEIVGEHGAAAMTELRYGWEVNSRWLQALELFGFYDIGAVWNDGDGGTTRTSLASAGGGVRVLFDPWVYLSIELAQPLTLTPGNEGDKDPRVFFSVSSRF